MKPFIYPLLRLLASTAPAFGVAITSPSDGAYVSSPFVLTASSATCSYQPVTTIGYSVDSGDTTMLSGKTSFDTSVPASIGSPINMSGWTG
ncbi:MAG: hypothetical protein WCE63_00770 [Acidobacteriaceae bacterium]